MSQVDVRIHLLRAVEGLRAQGMSIEEVIALVIDETSGARAIPGSDESRHIVPLSDVQQAAVNAYKAQRADRARNADLTQANPVGPRFDEVNGQLPEQRSGTNPNPPVGPEPVPYSPPSNGKWVSNGNGSERFVPEASWTRPVVETPDREPSVPQVKIVSIPNTGSHVGVRNGRTVDLQACGPIGVEWVDQSK